MIYLLYITALLNVGLGLFTFINKPRSKINVYFFLVSIGIGLWAVSNALFQESPDAQTMYLWAIIAYIVAMLMLCAVKVFSYAVSNKPVRGINKYLTIVIGVFGLLGPLVPNLISVGVDFPKRAIKGGPLLSVLFVCYLYLILDSQITLFLAQRKAIGARRTQLKLIFIGLLGAVVAGTITNLILPATGIYNAVAFGPTFTLILLSVISYAIVRHRLFDIRVLVGRIVYYLVTTSLPYIMFFLLVTLYTSLFGSVFALPVYFVSIFVGIAFVVTFNWLNEFIRTQVNSRLINPGYNPLETAEKLSNDLSVMIDLPRITDAIIAVISRTIRPNFSSIVVFADEDHKVDRVFGSDPTKLIPDIKKLKNTVTTLWQATGKHPIVLDEIEAEMIDGIYRNVPNIARELKPIMEAVGAKVILSVGEQENILGIYIIGQKEADSPYTSSDIEFLKSIGNTGALAIQRSLLYSEVQEFANTLQLKVDQATAELQKTNKDLEATLAQLQEVRRQERDMIDVMGHELRTPISIVRNALVMLERLKDQTQGKISPAELSKYLDMSLESSRREITLIETLLSATKVDNARIQLYFVKSDMVDMVDDAIEGQKTPISQKHLEVKYNRPSESIWVYADRTRAQEIIDNFLSNAIKYTLQGSVTINTWKDSQFGWTSVKDTGIGISEEDMQNLGKKFFRAKQHIPKSNGSSTEVVRPGGTGLGLYVTFDLIKIMGGSLYINSKVGEGTTFTYSLPLYTGQPEKQVDQTFDNTIESTKAFIYLNKEAPQPPKAAVSV
jgi:signal transduction histidine kinase